MDKIVNQTPVEQNSRGDTIIIVMEKIEFNPYNGLPNTNIKQILACKPYFHGPFESTAIVTKMKT